MPTRHPGLLVLVAQKHVQSENPTFAKLWATRFRVAKVSIVRAWGLVGPRGAQSGGLKAPARTFGGKVTSGAVPAPPPRWRVADDEELVRVSLLRRKTTAQA